MRKHMMAISSVSLMLFTSLISSNEDEIFCNGFEKLPPIGFGELTDIFEFKSEGAAGEFAVADFNGDGFSDLIVAYLFGPPENPATPILILLNDGKGSFVDGTSELIVGSVPETIWAREIVLGDFNADGKSDVFIADHGWDWPPFPGNQNILLLSTAENKLTDVSSTLPQQSDYTHSATAGDIDGDGDLDIFIGNLNIGLQVKPQIWINDSTGNFTVNVANLPSPQIMELSHTTSLFVDANGDGNVDLVLGESGGDTDTIILLNDGNGVFNVPVLGALPFFSGLGDHAIAHDIQSAFINEDDLPDLFILFTSGESDEATGRAIQVLINNGDGTFRDESTDRLLLIEPDGDWWKYLHLFDIDGDCDFDILKEGDGELYLFENNGSGVFTRKLTGLPPLFPDGQSFEVIDIDNDGALDIVGEAGGVFIKTFNAAPACSLTPKC